MTAQIAAKQIVGYPVQLPLLASTTFEIPSGYQIVGALVRTADTLRHDSFSASAGAIVDVTIDTAAAGEDTVLTVDGVEVLRAEAPTDFTPGTIVIELVPV